MTDRSVPLETLLARWVADGLVSADQAAAIRAATSRATEDGADVSVPVAAPRWPLVVEALGYLGGVVILVAAGLVTAQFWADLSTGGRVTFAAVVTIVLITGGLLVPRGAGTLISDPGRRLCAVLLGLGVAGTAATLGLVGADVLDLQDESVGLFTTTGTALVAGVLAWRRPSVLQQVATVVPLALAAGVLASRIGAESFGIGLAVWAVGPAWYALGRLELFGPRRADAPLAAVVCVAGSVVATETDAGIALALATVVALVALALAWRDLLMLGIAALGAFLVLPPAVSTWFPGSVAAPVALLVVGVGLVAVAIVLARGRGVRRSG